MFLIGSLLILAGKDDMHESSDKFEIWPDRLRTTELAVLERMKKKSPYTYNGSDVIKFSPLF